MKRAVLSACILAFALLLTACGPASSDSTASASDPASGEQAFHYGGDVTLRILSGSENQELEGILDDFARERGVNIEACGSPLGTHSTGSSMPSLFPSPRLCSESARA